MSRERSSLTDDPDDSLLLFADRNLLFSKHPIHGRCSGPGALLHGGDCELTPPWWFTDVPNDHLPKCSRRCLRYDAAKLPWLHRTYAGGPSLSRYNPHHSNSEQTLSAAATWRERCLLHDLSVFSEKSLWSPQVLDEVDARFNGAPDAGKDKFQHKLARQFNEASAEAVQSVAEMLWAMNLFPSNIGAHAKRTAIMEAWNWSGNPLALEHPLLDENLLAGLGSAGPGFLAHRPRELRFLINAVRQFKRKSSVERRELLDDPWEFAQWLDEVPDEGYRQLKHILPFLLFPDSFERIASPGDGRSILSALGGLGDPAVKRLSKVERDRALLNLRRDLEANAGGPIDFYDPEYKSIWTPEVSTPAAAAADAPRSQALARSRPPLNQILYGPPGTGKTYRTIDRAIEILDPKFASENAGDHPALKRRFDELDAEGRIRFVTFHQSFGYEDFVEGLRAEARPDGSIHYYVADGVLKDFCRTPRLAAGTKFGSGYTVLRSTDEILWLQKPNGSNLPMPWAIVDALLDYHQRGEIAIEDIRRTKVFDKIPDSGLEKYFVNGYNNVLAPVVAALAAGEGREEHPKVLIVDEINRGNVSKIFGELITLIELSKRAGADEALSVVLPYSKERFSLPPGLHIIGTMNTADRSLTGVDIALRRRFAFEEVEPDSSALDGVEVAGVDVAKLLDTMNARIEALLDRDHRLGHAYFLGLEAGEGIGQLRDVFVTQIFPLLQEYFYDDWARVRLVLNDHRKPDPLDRFVVTNGADSKQLFGADEPEAPSGKVWRLNPEALGRPSAYYGILG